MPGTHLNSDDRSSLNICKNQNQSIATIADSMGRHRSTLYREQKRALQAGAYCPLMAQENAESLRKGPRKQLKATKALIPFIEAKLKEGMSPECISGRQKKLLIDLEKQTEKKAPTIEPPLQIGISTIYKIISQDRKDNGELFKLLPRRGKRYYKHPTSATRQGRGRLPVKPEQDIKQRPLAIEARAVPGHWEIDLVFSGPTIFFTGIDRMSRLAFVRAIPSKEKEVVTEQFIELCLKHDVRTATTDRGLEWSGLNEAALNMALASIDVNLYFCTPYHSWEKGSIENFNGVLRRYFPKGKHLEWNEARKAEARDVEYLLNELPRKGLGFKSPREVDEEWTRKQMEELWKHGMNPPLTATA